MEKKEKVERYLTRNLVLCLTEIFGPDARHADKALDRQFKINRKWGSRDRRFFAENLYEVVRWWRTLTEFAKLNPEHIIEWSEPEWAALWETLSVFKAGELDVRSSSRAVQESIPDWLDQLGKAELGDQWPSILHSLNQPAVVDLRVNLARTTREEVLRQLLAESIETEAIPNSSCGLTLTARKNVFVTNAYKEGMFEVQDRSSQKVAELLKPKSGDRVIDACAGAGGKTLHLADLMKNRGQILALDINDRKLLELKVRARRAQLSCIETRVIDSTKVIKRLSASADHLLLDVPCSGLGVLRRNPDTKWKLKPENLSVIYQRQDEILSIYSRMVKPGGFMVYSTCSILPSENETRIETFLKTHPNWTKIDMLRINPDQQTGDGFFAAKLQLTK